MSLCIAVLQNDCAFISVDSALSVMVNGIPYRSGNNGQKIWTIDNQLIFCSGKMVLAKEIMSHYIKGKNRDISYLAVLAKSIYDDNVDKYTSEIGEKILSDILACKFDNDQVRTYFISPDKDFEISELSVDGNDTKLWAGGFKSEKAIGLMKYYGTRNQRVEYIFQNTYNVLSDETIGGYLKIYRVSNLGVELFYSNKIKESNIKTVNPINGNPYKIAHVTI